MALLLLLVLADTWPVAYGNALLRALHTYDVVRYDVRARPLEDGLEVDCGLTIDVERPGPVRLLLSTDAQALEVTRDGRPVAAELGAAGFGDLARLVAPEATGIPGLLTLPDVERGRATFRLRYVWRPPPGAVFYAARGDVQTHLYPFWLPVIAGELFDATLDVRTDKRVLAPGRRTRTETGWRFETAHPTQILPLVVGDFEVAAREADGRRLEVWTPPRADVDARSVLDDLAAVIAQLEARFGRGVAGTFRVAVEPRFGPRASFCAGPFVVLSRTHLPGALLRPSWLALLAHECAHVWWGHRLATPVVGRGGTWLREGLAQWSGIEVAGALAGPEAERGLWRACFRIYVSRLDLRRNGDGTLFANEVPLRDATYLDESAVPYMRGALVLRLLEHRLGTEEFTRRLRAFGDRHAYAFARLEDFAAALDAEDVTAYYGRSTRLPDLRLLPGGRIACADPDWPGGVVPVAIETDEGVRTVGVDCRGGSGILRWDGPARRIEVDPERIFLDPIRSNNLAEDR